MQFSVVEVSAVEFSVGGIIRGGIFRGGIYRGGIFRSPNLTHVRLTPEHALIEKFTGQMEIITD